ncbi:hypothetical protein [Saccharothrix longispora]|uniref:hypothetical protein n=1 Tax=Saccharothrix longispora TaxID=33920 RepID=UPI0028FD99C9|nr:hypothetical protein [Saccharothrix longispora]MDU0295016.1 hypothetical protein [Saccharothrix longispora]
MTGCLAGVRDGRLHFDDLTVLLAEPVRIRSTACLNHRNRRRAHTADPHLFIRYRTVLGAKPVGGRRLGLIPGIAARDIRADRILGEVRTTGGDVRRVRDLFGLSVEGALRCTCTRERADSETPVQ